MPIKRVSLWLAPMNREPVTTFRIGISGMVQGVGFRPFIYRLARQLGISGWVENRNDGVTIVFNATPELAERFRQSITGSSPDAADIDRIDLEPAPAQTFSGFEIRSSSDLSPEITEISPDIAVCRECLRDMQVQPHRSGYPFINCTRCGPRFTIIRDLPYDRASTTMDRFRMCETCRSEYEEVSDRRFHAQPVACNRCGPSYTLMTPEGTVRDLSRILVRFGKELKEGGIFAVKGMGGYHLMCDAFHEEAVLRLRAIKERDGKPFALMARSPEAARTLVEMSREEQEMLVSWRRPIVLLRSNRQMTPGLADGLSTLGIMLPYMPFHHLLFQEMSTDAVVLTSCNRSEEPLMKEDEQVLEHFGKKVDGVLTYNREIFNRCDDPVGMVVNGKTRLVRRARGYVPAPLRTDMETEGIFAAGAELVNSFALGKGRSVFMSQYIGDLKNWATFRFYRETYERFCRMFRFRPAVVAHDLHPDYFSTRFALELAQQEPGIRLIPVQHHHAHIASVMLEHRLGGEVIGFSLDGMGLGDDGTLWGAEALIGSLSGYRRRFHFEYVPLPGGDRASTEPWRMAVSYLYHYRGEGFRDLPLPVLTEAGPDQLDLLVQMIRQKVNSPLISSAGRLFDAVSALLGLVYKSSYQAEAPMRLESLADPSENSSYPFEIRQEEVCFRPMFARILQDLEQRVPASRISARFHHTLVRAVVEMALKIREETSINRVILSGGSYQNRILVYETERQLQDHGFRVSGPGEIPVNDQGIAAGQLAVAANILKMN